eukprot:1309896-Amphidinium_carterae.1
MELHTRAVEQNVDSVSAGSYIYAAVKDSRDQNQGCALFAAVAPASPEVHGAAVSAWLVGASDPYYLWWAEQKAGPAMPPAAFKVLLVPVTTSGTIPQDASDAIITQEYILLDPDLLHMWMADHSFTGWSLDSMKRMRRRYNNLQPHIRGMSVQGRVADRPDAGGGVERLLNAMELEEAPAEMLNRDSLEAKLAAAREELKRGREEK